MQKRLSKPAVIFLHAFPMNKNMWNGQIAKVKELGFTVLTPEYAGFGNSPEPKRKMSIEDYAEDIHEKIIAENISSVITVGLSMGGYVALSLYRLYPSLFRGLVLCNTRATADNELTKENRYKIIDSLETTHDTSSLFAGHLEKFYTPTTLKNNEELLKQTFEIFNSATVKGIIEAQRAMANRPDSIPLLRRIDFPVLIIAGAKDHLTTVEDARYMHNEIRQGDLEIIPGAAHISNMEKPQQFNTALLKYLSTHF